MIQERESSRLRSRDILGLLSGRSAWRLIRGISWAAIDKDFAGRPLAVCWFTNFSCNAKCHFCCKAAEIRRGRERFPVLPLDQAYLLMSKIRTSVDMLYLSGGEPTIHPHIIEILAEAQRLEFSSVGISSNLICLDQKLEMLDYIDAIGVSIHSTDPARHAQNLCVSFELAQRVFANLNLLRQHSRKSKLRVLVNCVINPKNLDDVPEMIAFTEQYGFLLELVPANDCGRTPADLYENPRYLALIDRVLELRRTGKAGHLAGSTHYYEQIRDFNPFRCFPYGVANITPDGRLCTPCDVAEQYAVNVLEHEHLKAAVKASYPHLGDFPCQEGRCFKAGIIERSRLFGMLAHGKEPQADS